MKKINYTLIALLLICLAVIGYLAYEKVGDQRQLKLMNGQIEDLSKDLDALRLEKLAWEGEKSRVARSLGSVQLVLRNTLDELDDVVDSIGISEEASDIMAAGKTTEKPVEADPEAEPQSSSTPSPSPKPASGLTQAPTEKPLSASSVPENAKASAEPVSSSKARDTTASPSPGPTTAPASSKP